MREVILSSLPPPNGHYSHAVIFNGARLCFRRSPDARETGRQRQGTI